jgi:hypothetical protein
LKNWFCKKHGMVVSFLGLGSELKMFSLTLESKVNSRQLRYQWLRQLLEEELESRKMRQESRTDVLTSFSLVGKKYTFKRNIFRSIFSNKTSKNCSKKMFKLYRVWNTVGLRFLLGLKDFPKIKISFNLKTNNVNNKKSFKHVKTENEDNKLKFKYE